LPRKRISLRNQKILGKKVKAIDQNKLKKRVRSKPKKIKFNTSNNKKINNQKAIN
jgi:hypothetical protein